MATLQQITDAFLRASTDSTLHLSEQNFDYSLVTYAAAPEIHDLGKLLSNHRRQQGENGTLHATARRLGALFRREIPSVSSLVKAYGLRAVEIANICNAEESSARTGVFDEHVGLDGTSLWACATSGKDTVALHLLACMLARIWTHGEAVIIWQELVAQQKLRLASSATETSDDSSARNAAASRAEITSEQLAEWDASARAWLQAADIAKTQCQMRFRLYADNISVPVSTIDQLHDAVLDAWTRALVSVDEIVSGQPKHVNDGAVILALSSWHLYPDIILEDIDQKITQGDGLFETGGLITLGIKSTEGDGRGAVWSLPLKEPRTYDEAVSVSQYSGVAESTVSFDEFLYVLLGCVVDTWDADGLPLDTKLDLLRRVCHAVNETHGNNQPPPEPLISDDPCNWTRLLGSAAHRFTQTQDVEKLQANRLFNFGRKKCPDFVASRRYHPPPVFGLCSFNILIHAFEDDIQSSVLFLRRWALRELNTAVLPDLIVAYTSCDYKIIVDIYGNTLATYDSSSANPTSVDTASHSLTAVTQFFQDTGENKHMYGEERLQVLNISPNGEEINVNIESEGVKSFGLLCGEPTLAAIFAPADSEVNSSLKEQCMTIEQLIRCLDNDDISKSHIRAAVHHMARKTQFRKYIKSLDAVAAAQVVFSELPGSKVNLRTAASPVRRAKWWKNMQSSSLRKELSTVFSCIIYFETGQLDLEPTAIGHQTFGFCYGSSIYAANGLFVDPHYDSSNNPVSRVTGNIGKAGLSLLVAPNQPRSLRVDATWQVVVQDEFAGEMLDTFEDTQLRLIFTGHQIPLVHKSKDKFHPRVQFVETCVSIFDEDRWVADLDVLSSSRRWKSSPDLDCDHTALQKNSFSLFAPLMSTESWQELIEPPLHNSVVRAYQNTAARLAAATMATRQSNKVVVLHPTACWTCVSDLLSQSRFDWPIGPVLPMSGNCEAQEAHSDSDSSSDVGEYDNQALQKLESDSAAQQKIVFIH